MAEPGPPGSVASEAGSRKPRDLLVAEVGQIHTGKGVHHSTDKLGRIQSLEPLISMGTLRFSRKHRTLLDELRQYPKAAHDDGPDALQMAVEASRRPRPSITVI